jgi:hypothetical protein
MKPAAGLLAIALTAAAADRTFELRGKLEPAPKQWLHATLSGAYTPFLADQRVNPNGSFKFKKVAAGTYTLIIGARNLGTVRQSVEVGPALADKNGRVQVTIPFRPEQVSGAAERRNTVNVRDLAISGEAKREYGKAVDRLRERDHQAAERHLRRAIELAPHGF